MRINKKNLGKDKSLSFLLIFWGKQNVFFCLYYGTEGVIKTGVILLFLATSFDMME